MKPKLHYQSLDYLTRERFISYSHQIREAVLLSPNSVLEIGKGSGLLAQTLGDIGLKVTTVDITADLMPSVNAAAQCLPFKANSFDLTICCQVLEHLRFRDALVALKEIKRVTKQYSIISLPDIRGFYSLTFYMPLIGKRNLSFSLPTIYQKKISKSSSHQWEIGRLDLSIKRTKEVLSIGGYQILKDFRDPENPYHHFFILG